MHYTWKPEIIHSKGFEFGFLAMLFACGEIHAREILYVWRLANG